MFGSNWWYFATVTITGMYRGFLIRLITVLCYLRHFVTVTLCTVVTYLWYLWHSGSFAGHCAFVFILRLLFPKVRKWFPSRCWFVFLSLVGMLGMFFWSLINTSESSVLLLSWAVPFTIPCCLCIALLWWAIVIALSRVKSAFNCIFSDYASSNNPTTNLSCIISLCRFPCAQCSAKQCRSVIKPSPVSPFLWCCELIFACLKMTLRFFMKCWSNLSFIVLDFLW